MATAKQLEDRLAKLDEQRKEMRKALAAAKRKEDRDRKRREAEAERAEAMALYAWAQTATIKSKDGGRVSVLDWYRSTVKDGGASS